MRPLNPAPDSAALAAAEAAHTAAARAYFADSSYANSLALNAAYRAFNEALYLENPAYADEREDQRQADEAGYDHYNRDAL